MLSSVYEVPAAVVVLGSGLLACFFGYRLFRIVIGVYGFILGAYLANSIFGMTETIWVVGAGVAGGGVGALVFWFAYLFAVALVGAGLGAVVADVTFRQLEREPQLWIVVAAAIAGAFVGFGLQRIVVILGTAFGGAWTALVGASLLGAVPHVDAAGRRLWEAFSINAGSAPQWVTVAWVVLGAVGTLAQFRTARPRRR